MICSTLQYLNSAINYLILISKSIIGQIVTAGSLYNMPTHNKSHWKTSNTEGILFFHCGNIFDIISLKSCHSFRVYVKLKLM